VGAHYPMKRRCKILRREVGSSTAEFGLIAALILLVSLVTLGNVGDETNQTFLKVATAFDGGGSLSTADGDEDACNGFGMVSCKYVK